MGLTPDILNEDFIDITSWGDIDTDTGVSEVSPASQLRLDTNTGAAGNAYAGRQKTITSPPNKFTMEVKTYFDLVGTIAGTDYASIVYGTGTWFLNAQFASDGLFIQKTGGGNTEVGVNIVKTGASKAWQIWRFQVDKSAGEAAAVVEVFLDNVSQGTVDCDYEVAWSAGLIQTIQFGYGTNDMVSHIEYIRIASGLGAINDTSNPQIIIF